MVNYSDSNGVLEEPPNDLTGPSVRSIDADVLVSSVMAPEIVLGCVRMKFRANKNLTPLNLLG